MTMKQDSISELPPHWMLKSKYEPAYKDTVTVFPEYAVTLPGPVPVTTHFEVRSPRPDTGIKRLENDYDWIAIVLVAGYLLLAFAKYNFPRRLNQLLKACFVPRAVAHLYREGNPFNEQISLALGLIYLLTSSLLIYVAVETFGSLPSDLIDSKWLYFAILAFNTIYWIIKALGNKMLAHIFKTYEATGNYLLNNLLFNLTLGLLLLIALPFVVYTGSIILLKITLVFTALMLFYKVLRGILVGLTIARFPLFYLFLYICTLEVAPLLIAAKLFIAYSGI
jgi:hypothetical protein